MNPEGSGVSSETQIPDNWREAGKSMDGPASLQYSIIPLFHHSTHAPAGAEGGGGIVQNKANLRRAVIGANYFVEKEL